MKAGWPVAGFAVLVLVLAAPAPAEELSLSLAAGNFFASQGAYREVYGSSVTFSADLWLKLKGPFGLAAGYGWVGDTGLAVPMDGGDAEYPVKFRRTSVPVVVFYQIVVKPVEVRLGAGLGIHRFKETWQTVDLGFSGHKVSARFVLTASVGLLGRLSFFGSAAYDTIPTGAGSPLVNEVNLGGLQLFGGVAFRIF